MGEGDDHYENRFWAALSECRSCRRIGKRLTFGAADGDTPPQTLTIIGVTGDFPTSRSPRNGHSCSVAAGAAYSPECRSHGRRGQLITESVPDRAQRDREQPLKMAAALENVVRELDPNFAANGSSPASPSQKDHRRPIDRSRGWRRRRGPDAVRTWNLRGRRTDGRGAHSRDRRAVAGASHLRVLGRSLMSSSSPRLVWALAHSDSRPHAPNSDRTGIPLSQVETLAYVCRRCDCNTRRGCCQPGSRPAAPRRYCRWWPCDRNRISCWNGQIQRPPLTRIGSAAGPNCSILQ